MATLPLVAVAWTVSRSFLDPSVPCAHWLNWKCGIGMNAAREKVRVANALAELPKISEAFSKGEISYSKVRATKNEDYLLMIARHGTAYHIADPDCR